MRTTPDRHDIGQPVNITREFTCTFCHLKDPAKAAKAANAECCGNCVRIGEPPLLTDPAGNHYVDQIVAR
jgi:hypothetical protein